MENPSGTLILVLIVRQKSVVDTTNEITENDKQITRNKHKNA